MNRKSPKTYFRVFRHKMTNERERIRLQFLFVYLIFGVVSFCMSLVNYLTGWYMMMNFTLVFGGLNVINMLLSIKATRLEYLARVLFAVEIAVIFTTFTVLGEPQGFSAIWIALLPAAGMLLYRKRAGTLLSLGMFLILVFLFWTPLGRSTLQYEYTESFLLRFPLLYVAFFAVGFFFELIRSITQEELNLSKEKYVKLSYTDQLTGLGNESRYLSRVVDLEASIAAGRAHFAVVFMDVNSVKATNDAYGHRYGCRLIVSAGKSLPQIFPGSEIFHIGGDEFVAIVEGEDYEHLDERIREFDERLQYQKITYEGTELVLSVARGHSYYCPGDSYSAVLQRADEAMYRNKLEVKEKYGISLR